ncbi:nif11-like leader peptide domain protein [Synechococcus sp. BIOS-E4-1]|uniref:Nif11-like leader peptide family natural product precursor n=1 Tax=Synechococcus sp. BIOS-E4-1 TaxID=1400864 RepID=UPI00164509D4|nr:Nif11-like leader peptide family natural product precursor [Synechococcus sp. BIOS-E4-1]QNI54185.1 nif11-like leader peptide domain protein [Synechococcus sp. BIOS-E4-1]
MSEEQLKAFIEEVKADISLQDKLKAAADVDAALAIAKEAGFSISADDVRTSISDEELEGAAGGYISLEAGCLPPCCTRGACSTSRPL